ncbi:C-type lectin domain family 4 member F-like [Thunnus thynnus]|uniref:C-type lectin domain family 4 member F-like n=1 Tax=Thunnus thynnus TaxID=8237 RepID=UPI003528523F
MEDVYVNDEPKKQVDSGPSTNQTGLSSSEKRFHGAVLCLGLLTVFLLAGLIGLSVYYLDLVRGLAEELSTIKANLTEERDLLNASLTEITEELHWLRILSAQDFILLLVKAVWIHPPLYKLCTLGVHALKTVFETRYLQVEGHKLRLLFNVSCLTYFTEKTCSAGWSTFSFTCYLISTKSGSWEKGRKDCRARGADLVVIDSYEEQEFLINITKQASWIGLSDREKEGTWKWTDGTPLTQA